MAHRSAEHIVSWNGACPACLSTLATSGLTRCRMSTFGTGNVTAFRSVGSHAISCMRAASVMRPPGSVHWHCTACPNNNTSCTAHPRYRLWAIRMMVGASETASTSCLLQRDTIISRLESEHTSCAPSAVCPHIALNGAHLCICLVAWMAARAGQEEGDAMGLRVCQRCQLRVDDASGLCEGRQDACGLHQVQRANAVQYDKDTCLGLTP